jgi:hypothetical protein
VGRRKGKGDCEYGQSTLYEVLWNPFVQLIHTNKKRQESSQ